MGSMPFVLAIFLSLTLNYLLYSILRERGVQSEHPVFLTEPSQNPPKTRAKIAEVMFEKLGVAALDIGDANVCALTAYGKDTGVTVDMGEFFIQDYRSLQPGMQQGNIHK